MHDPTENQPPLDGRAVAVRYLCALAPMLFDAVILFMAVLRRPDRLGLVLLNTGLALAGLVLMRWRRHRPVPIATATTLLTSFSTMATGPAQVVYVSLVTHRRWRQIVPIAILSWVCLVVRSSWFGIDQATYISTAAGTMLLGGLTVFGLYLRGRRDLAASERQAVLAAEREQLQRIEQARLAERVQIAQEMHDVLAHRLSLLSMLAGGLAYRRDLGAEQTRETALAIQENAHRSLNELRAVLGTLRDDGAAQAPQPTLAHLETLFGEVRAAGQRVEVRDAVGERGLLPEQTGRHAYRIVQEALTNARKHAPGGEVTVELCGRPGEGLRIRVGNPVPGGTPAGPGARLGLVGLAERIRMAGGTLGHAVRDGHFVLDARLPWEASHRDSTGDRG
ncbi:sensor histidine kinase [Streptosporangium sp. NPDC050855]|uniref:sensor histidine kinase n=1 Tax=Streptosporangium sp. NPDC050855 TaxID=3366194 RepID=UPI0037AA692F